MDGFAQNGFDDFNIMMDEKRFQQVQLNYQSNAIKFIDKKRGKIVILLQFVPRKSLLKESTPASIEFLKKKVTDFYRSNIMEVDQDWNLPDPYELLQEGDSDKIVLSVLDNGVGIKDEDKDKLYKLFGCLKETQRMNTQGIGLGLVISKMITEEFGGKTRFFSKHTVGSIFQSSFEIDQQASCFDLR